MVKSYMLQRECMFCFPMHPPFLSPAYSPLKCTLLLLLLFPLLLPHFLSSVSASRLRQSSAHPGAAADREYAFEMACSNIRYGEGVTREVGMDLENLGVRNVCVLTDKNVRPELCVHLVQLLPSLHPTFLHASLFSLVLFFPPFSYSAALVLLILTFSPSHSPYIFFTILPLSPILSWPGSLHSRLP